MTNWGYKAVRKVLQTFGGAELAQQQSGRITGEPGNPEVATLAIVSNGAQKVQTRRLAESGVMNFMEDVFISEKMGCEKPNARIFDAALRALGVENREHVLMVGDSLASDIQGGSNAGLDTCWYNPNHAENPGKVIPTYEIASLEELYPLVMEQEELANVGLKNRRHQC